MKIRKATEKDYNQVWEIFSRVIETGDTYVFDPKTSKSDLRKHWFTDYMQTFIAEENGTILGTYIIKPNQSTWETILRIVVIWLAQKHRKKEFEKINSNFINAALLNSMSNFTGQVQFLVQNSQARSKNSRYENRNAYTLCYATNNFPLKSIKETKFGL